MKEFDKNIINEIFKNRLEIFHELDNDEKLTLSLGILAWYKSTEHKSKESLIKFLEEEDLTRGLNLNELRNNEAFELKLKEIIFTIDDFNEKGILEKLDPSDSCLLFNSRDMFALDAGFCDLLTGLLGEITGKSVYLPWEYSGQFVGRMKNQDADIYIENVQRKNIASLVSKILGVENEMKISNPINRPSFVEDGKLKQFDIAVCCPPIYQISSLEKKGILEMDLFQRFSKSPRSVSSSVLALEHLLCQTKGKIVFVVPNGFLFRSGSEKDLREELLRKGILEAVIHLPGGLSKVTSIPFSVLLIDTEKQNKFDSVRFIDVDIDVEPSKDKDYFLSAQKSLGVQRNKRSLENIKELVDIVMGKKESPLVAKVPVAEILEKESTLQMKTYIKDEKEDLVNKIFNQKERVSLENLVEIIRPVAAVITDDPKDLVGYEVQSVDIPEFGYIRKASKKVNIDKNSKRVDELLLRENDIVFSVKGLVGKVGIVGPKVNEDNQRWLVGSSSVALRLKSERITPHGLALFLKSEAGQHLINKLTQPSSSTIGFMKISQLAELEIPVPLNDPKYKSVLDNEESVQEKILQLQESLKKSPLEEWKLQ